jgi:hypothetical protein
MSTINLDKDRRLLAFKLANDVIANIIILNSVDCKLEDKYNVIFEYILNEISDYTIIELETIRTLYKDKNFNSVESLILASRLLNI